MIRAFLAIDIPEEIRTTLERHSRKWKKTAERSGAASIRWVRSINWHLTLKFLGDTPEPLVQQIIQVVEEAAKACAPFTLILNGTGAFPAPHRPRILWAGLKDQTGSLEGLNRHIQNGLAPLGIPEERKAFHPHITIARIKKPGPGIRRFADYFLADDIGDLSFTVSSVTLYRSVLKPGGAEYTVLHRADLHQEE